MNIFAFSDREIPITIRKANIIIKLIASKHVSESYKSCSNSLGVLYPEIQT